MRVGVDPHKDSLELAACDELGRKSNSAEFPNTIKGCQQALEWIRKLGSDVEIGIECSGTFGAVLARMLNGGGFKVLEVPTLLTYGERRRRPAQGKSDPVDALAIARAVARGDGLSLPKFGGVCEEMKLLVDERKSLVSRKTQLVNKTHSDLVILRPGYHRQIPNLSRRSHVLKAKRLVGRDRSTRGSLIIQRLAEIERLISQIASLEKLIKAKVIESGTSLHTRQGISYVLAATILGEVGHPSRIRSEAAFAMFNGTAPVQASSGRHNHHRLNRRGNRELNYAIHTAAVVRMRRDEKTKTYILKKLSEGKSRKDAMRCLKRHISNEIYRSMITDVLPLESAA